MAGLDTLVALINAVYAGDEFAAYLIIFDLLPEMGEMDDRLLMDYLPSTSSRVEYGVIIREVDASHGYSQTYYQGYGYEVSEYDEVPGEFNAFLLRTGWKVLKKETPPDDVDPVFGVTPAIEGTFKTFYTRRS